MSGPIRADGPVINSAEESSGRDREHPGTRFHTAMERELVGPGR